MTLDTSRYPATVAVLLEQPFPDDASVWWARVVDGGQLAGSRENVDELDVIALTGTTANAVTPKVDELLAGEWFLPRGGAWQVDDDAPSGRPFWTRVFQRPD